MATNRYKNGRSAATVKQPNPCTTLSRPSAWALNWDAAGLQQPPPSNTRTERAVRY